ncbi:TolC family protein [bacterium]|nr:MAG: TolC family protein [bacterium]
MASLLWKCGNWRRWAGLAAALWALGGPTRALAQIPSALGESDVLSWVVRRNLGIQAAAYDPQIAGTDITKTKGQFDTQVSGEASYNLDRSDQTSIIFGTDNRTVVWDAKAEKKFPVGVQGAISLGNQRESTNSAFATDPAFFDTRLRFDVKAAMLKNRFGKSDKAQIALAEAGQKVSEELSRTVVEDRAAEAVTSYWNWVATRYYVEVARRFLKLAQDFLDTTQSKKVLGLAEDTDTLGAQALVVERQAELERAKNLSLDAEKRLRYLLDDTGGKSWRAKDPLRSDRRPGLKEDLLQTALQSRPEYLALRREAEAKDIQITLAKDQKWPSLDLFTSLELNSVDPSYGTVLRETFSAQHPNWLIGAQFSLSIENRIAKGELDRGKLEKAKVLVQMKELENLISLEIDESWREVLLQRKETDNFTRAADLQRRKMEEETRKYFLGRSDSDTIVRFQEDALAAERKRLEAELRYRLAWVQLRKSAGILVPSGAESQAGAVK